LTDLGVEVTHLPYELHPEIPEVGRSIRADGRLAPTFHRVAIECGALGLPWRPPTRMPNTRRALETAEWVRTSHPTAAATLHAGIFEAHFGEGLAIDDPDLLDDLVGASGAPPASVRAAVDAGAARILVEASMAAARAAGVTSTPAWVLDGGFVVPGVLDRATMARWITKIAEHHPTTS